MRSEIPPISTRFPDVPKGMTPTYTFYDGDGVKSYTQNLYEDGVLKKSRGFSIEKENKLRNFWTTRMNPDGSKTVYSANHVHCVGTDGVRLSAAYQEFPNASGKSLKSVGPSFTDWAGGKDRQFALGMKGKLQKMATKIACDANGCERKGLKNIGGFLFKLAQKI